MIRPVFTYWSETGTLTTIDENNLRIFERQILRKIFGPVNIDNIWKIRNNMDIDKLIEGTGIVRFIKEQRIKWLEHIQRMDQARPTRKLLEWRPMGTRPVEIPRQRWQEDIMEDLKKLKVKNWKETANLEKLGWEGETPQRVVVPNDDDDADDWCNVKCCIDFRVNLQGCGRKRMRYILKYAYLYRMRELQAILGGPRAQSWNRLFASTI
jgi:hypothetical protein